ncbi:MAG: protein translocase subunit SecF, partial [Pseudomonadota bacterium]
SGGGVIAAVLLTAVLGLNFGIDFRGGTMIEARTVEAADLGEVRAAVTALDLGDVAVQSFGSDRDVLVRVEEQTNTGDERMAVAEAVGDALVEAIPGTEIRRVEVVGPKVSGELLQAGILAITLAVAAVLVYIWLRFEWQFGVGAVVALVHDVGLTIGIFALLGIEFNLAIIAALLTIVGYSLNDTVVVYDRVRENLRKYKKMELSDLLDLSVNETLSRTLMTSLTTLVALLALFLLGPAVIQGFTFAMIWGVLIGTYSSIFIAAAMLLAMNVKRDWSDPGEAAKAGVQFGGAQV